MADEKLERMKMFYNTTLSQVFSPCGNYLLAGNSYGEISVYDLQDVLNTKREKCSIERRPLYTFKPYKDELSINSLASNDDYLIIGTRGEISGFHWETITTMKNPALSWSIAVPSNNEILQKNDINSLALNQDGEKVYAGCGDNNMYCFDLECRKLLQSFTGHNNYIHSVQCTPQHIITASEDGSAKLWDYRKTKEINSFQPYLQKQLNRPSLGKWLGAASISDDWLLCGGGPHLSLWHLRSMSLAESFTNVENNGIHVALFHEDRILAGGVSSNLTQLSFTGDVLALVPSASTCIYSVAIQERPHKVLAMAGSSSKIDICTNFNYRGQVLLFK